ncbi:pentapeptide repeat-containing protein [Pseudarthrobacter sp. J75]|uniref:pentapeptide repeat-containing protein n=1 Tax=unclassified Pseudarthrobacter TaxID=2647000 RepID=UPI002E81F4E0|nr:MULTISPECIES: pentapeptide repeat-containing protein [unclassified Pseudarthrobacter]MEE2523764.1 pentapeptide repeat-containing protein [Pseudarthrobacter sp. J47]MEE2529930.1 pentapeptide repeat-containing protein [Pseudarthrobacter sp. J75]
MTTPLPSPALRPDCANCFALCCTAFGFSRSADFAVDKPPATPCANLADDFSCTIHASLPARGFRGCTVFDCFGAGQAVSQQLFDGVSWRANPSSRTEMFAAFGIVRQLHEMLWHLDEAGRRTFDPDLAADAYNLSHTISAVTRGAVRDLLTFDVGALHVRVRNLLMEVSEEVRAGFAATGSRHRGSGLHAGADLVGGAFRGQQLCGADLRSALLIGADLRDCELSGADLLGADLRDARLHGAQLERALYLTQPQVNAAAGDAATTLPDRLAAPPHWFR